MLPTASLWLARCCEPLEGLQDATLFIDAPGAPAARWPDPDDDVNEAHAAVASAAFASRRASTQPRAKTESGEPVPGRLVALPIALGQRKLAVIVLTCREDAGSNATFEAAVDSAAPWLAPLLAQPEPKKGGGRQALLTKLITTLLEPEQATAAFLALVSELATALASDRVSLGFVEEQEVRLAAVSHSARFDARTRLGRSIQAAMEEAIDAEAGVRWPDEEARAVRRAHAELCQSQEMACALSVPLTAHGQPIGALCVEYRSRHSAAPVIAARLEQLATLLGPLIALRREQGRPLVQRLRKAGHDALEEWTRGSRRVHRFVLGGLAFILMSLALAPGTHRIGSPARLEGLVQRAIVAPIEGYVAESRARAGDVIERGQVLGAIDDTDLRLERRKWLAREAQLSKEYRAALAARDRSEASILRARLAQATAELDLVEEKLTRTRLVAPFSGVVAEGDLSRSLGSPVERGEVLFQVAPLDRYRIVLEVDETEIDEVEPGQRGWLKLTAQPGDPLPLVVERVVPIAVSEDGRNFFRVEAQLDTHVDALRPGMEGVGKIEAGRRSLLWIYTHPLVDWLRLRFWAWVP